VNEAFEVLIFFIAILIIILVVVVVVIFVLITTLLYLDRLSINTSRLYRREVN